MTTIWLVEGSQTVRRMVEIALDALPVKVIYGAQIDDLIKASHPTPSLLLCAQRFGRGEASDSLAYQKQAQKLSTSGVECPMILLLDQRALAEGYVASLKIAELVRKPFKTQDLIKAVAKVLHLEVPHAKLFDESKRVIPLARTTQSAITTHSTLNPQTSVNSQVTHSSSHLESSAQIPTGSTSQLSTPAPSSVGSLMNAVTPIQQRPSKPARPIISQVAPLPQGSSLTEAQKSQSVSQSVLGTRLRIDEQSVSTDDLSPLPLISTPPAHQISRGAIPLPERASASEETAVDTPALKASDLYPNTSQTSQSAVAQAQVIVKPSTTPTISADALAATLKVIHATTEQALGVAQRASQNQSQNHTGSLSVAEQRALIERIAWEVVPTIAIELIQSELRQRS